MNRISGSLQPESVALFLRRCKEDPSVRRLRFVMPIPRAPLQAQADKIHDRLFGAYYQV